MVLDSISDVRQRMNVSKGIVSMLVCLWYLTCEAKVVWLSVYLVFVSYVPVCLVDRWRFQPLKACSLTHN